ncbi:MAG TPA: hypothetical protein VHD69_00725 [Candidatus Paceibacterota bacterium]|nr:hypothetical protein [Candidatus Paceibacterota bacterium]
MKFILILSILIIAGISVSAFVVWLWQNFFSRFGRRSMLKLVAKREIDGITMYVVQPKVRIASARDLFASMSEIDLAPAWESDMVRCKQVPLPDALFVSTLNGRDVLTLATHQHLPHELSNVSSLPLAPTDCYACIDKTEANSREYSLKLRFPAGMPKARNAFN